MPKKEQMYLIGYDLGSSSVKACLLDGETNQKLYTSQYPKTEMQISSPQAGWAEQDPASWWEALKKVTHELLSKTRVEKERIHAVGIAYQMHGLVVVDKNQKVLRPSIIWCDSRAVNQGTKAFEALGKDYCLSSLLNSPGNFTAAKLAWVKENEPETYQAIDKFMLPGDYLAMKMSGSIQTTASGLSEGIFYDYKKNAISDEIMTYFDFDRQLLPEVVPTFSKQASLSKGAAEELGLHDKVLITYRAGDQPNNALSLNVLQPGEIAATAGTSGVIYGIADRPTYDPLSRVNAFVHVNHEAEKNRMGILLCINGTGILYSWAKQNLSISSYEELNRLAAQVGVGSGGVEVIPFGNGAERILNNRNLGAQISNLHLTRHSRAHIVRAIKEGIAFSFKYGMEIMSDMGISPTVIRAGKANMFQSPIFCKAISNLANVEIELYDTDGAQGAARGAGIGLGYYGYTEAFSGLTKIEVIRPKHALSNQYLTHYASWKKSLKLLLDN